MNKKLLFQLSLLCLLAFSFVELRMKSGEPKLFAPHIISTQDDEAAGTFTPDGKQYYYTKRNPTTQRSSVILICTTSLINGNWSAPTLAPFSGPYKDLNPFITKDGSRFYFISTRPIVDGKPKADADIWFMEKVDTSWGPPKNIGSPVNSEFFEQSISVSTNGTLYFSSTRDRRSLDIYKSILRDGVYQEPENLGDAINSPDFNEQDVFIAPDESYLIFSCTGRPDGIVAKSGAQYSRSDLYISYFKEGKWTKATTMGAPINSEADESNPSVSPDGKTLYFTSKRNFASTSARERISYPELIKKLRNSGNGLGDVYSTDFESIALKKN